MTPQLDLRTKLAIVQASIRPAAVTANTNGVAIDCDLGDAFQQQATAILSVGPVSGTSPTFAVKIQESADNETWVDVTGATFGAAATNTNQVISFLRSRRYVRAVGTIGGTSTPTLNVCCTIIQTLKLQG